MLAAQGCGPGRGGLASRGRALAAWRVARGGPPRAAAFRAPAISFDCRRRAMIASPSSSSSSSSSASSSLSLSYCADRRRRGCGAARSSSLSHRQRHGPVRIAPPCLPPAAAPAALPRTLTVCAAAQARPHRRSSAHTDAPCGPAALVPLVTGRAQGCAVLRASGAPALAAWRQPPARPRCGRRRGHRTRAASRRSPRRQRRRRRCWTRPPSSHRLRRRAADHQGRPPATV